MAKRFFIVGIVFLLTVSTVVAQRWTDNSFADFSKGVLDASGQNLYVSKQGEVKSIRRYDINNDGYIDLLFNSTHDHATNIYPIVASVSQHRTVNVKPLEVNGSLYAAVEDLNNDGYPDIVFCPNHSGLQQARKFISIVWGGEDGLPRERSNGMLPVYDPINVVIADLNEDGWPDIVALNKSAWLPGQPSGNILRVYRGSSSGFDLTAYKDWGVVDAFNLVAGDYDGNGFDDVAVMSRTGELSVLMSGSENLAAVSLGRDIGKPSALYSADIDSDGYSDVLFATDEQVLYIVNGGADSLLEDFVAVNDVEATSISTGDINGDGYVDLVFTNFVIKKAGGGELVGGDANDGAGIEILWGGDRGFTKEDRTMIFMDYVANITVMDCDGDGKHDIVAAVFQTEGSFAANSVILYGKGDRSFEPIQMTYPTNGAHHIVEVPSTSGRGGAFVICNTISGTPAEKVPLLLYYGGKDGFDKERLVKIPFSSGYESTAVDLNEDGLVDILSINSMHGADIDDPFGGVNILWGGDSTYNDRTILHEVKASTSNVADLNRDGYLDIVVGFFTRPDSVSSELVIYYGDKDGHSRKNRKTIPCEGRSSSPMIADFNKDGWLDIVVTSFKKDLVRIFWGGPKGFDEFNREDIPAASVIDLEVADLNNDGLLDIILCHYKDMENDHHDMGISILWGNEAGFKRWNAQWLPAYTALGPVVADFDHDGYLDIFCPAYHGDLMREAIAMYLYWGDSEGFSKKNRTVLIGDAGSDALAADFNKDGLIDLAVANHTTQGDHSAAKSKVYYNDGNRFKSSAIEVDELPSAGVHWMWNKDMGHIYHRKWEQTYTSRVFNWIENRSTIKLTFEATLPEGPQLLFFVRSSDNEHNLEDEQWTLLAESGKADLPDTHRFLQYQAKFISANGDRYPVLKEVALAVE